MTYKFNFPIKTAVMLLTAVFFIVLIDDWSLAGAGVHLAVGIALDDPSIAGWTIWARLVEKAGLNIAGLGSISVWGMIACVGLVAVIAENLLAAAGVENRWSRKLAVLLTSLAFVATPGFLRAATRIDPLMISLVLPFVGFAIFSCLASLDRIKQHRLVAFFALILAGYGLAEGTWIVLCATPIVEEAAWAFGVFALVGVLPGAIFVGLTVTKHQIICLSVWAAAVVVAGAFAFASLDEGRAAERVAKAIVANARENDRIAVASDGTLDDIFALVLPQEMRLVTLAREHDPKYDKELASWIRENGEAESAEDLSFAAELGARILMDEWMKLDKGGFEAKVALPLNYFPTAEKWREACAMIRDVGDDPLAEYLVRMVGACGNELGCKLLERGDNSSAWDVFWEIAESVDRGNYSALVNLSGMLERGYEASGRAAEIVAQWRKDVEAQFNSPAMIAFAARASGRLYVDPAVREMYEAKRLAAIKRGELSPEAREFAKRLSALVENREFAEARQEIRKAVGEGLVGIDRIGERLLTLDRALGNWECAERDAIEILRVDRHHAAANAVMGTVNARRSNWTSAERYLRRAGEDANALNDLAYVLTRTGRSKEAVPLARRAVAMQPENWNFHDTLGVALIRSGEVAAGEAEFVIVDELKDKERGQ